MKEIKLIPEPPFPYKVDVAVMDFTDEGERQRCKITVEFAPSDMKELQKRGMDFEAAMKDYEDWIYGVVRYHLAQDWKCVEGWDQVLGIVKNGVRQYYK